ncbi:uncharacterized protein At4g02000-like [Quercus lobata]|uniref:uncharacterized protein At4g02000-like n=1 Tax=Quercus lobata TaxID=97700 RepID=UPI001247D9E1|nr:uncharacterized protein At4g02000-like [Quercus lobata]
MDVTRIIQSEPWCFDKHLVVLESFDDDVPACELQFRKAMFWVQVHNIPIRFMMRGVAKSICDIIGEVGRSIGEVEEDDGSFIRVKVTLDISLPLCRDQLVSFENGKKFWVKFKYERLPNICYWCGHLDHGDKDCKLWIESKGTLTPDHKQFD